MHNTCKKKSQNAQNTQSTEIILCNKPHCNKTEGHWETILSEVDKLKETGEYSKIYVNKGLRNEIKDAKINRRPDIMAVRHNGIIDQFEVMSKTDKTNILKDRMNNSKLMMGNRAGNTRVITIEGK